MSDVAGQGAAEPVRTITTGLVLSVARTLFVESWRRTRLAWIVVGAFAIADSLVDTALGPRGCGYYAWLVIAAIIGIVISAAATRALLGYTGDLWNLNGEFRRYLLVSLLLDAPVVVLLLPLMVVVVEAVAPVGLILIVILVVVSGLVIFWLRVLLWPIGLLVGERDMTLEKSWRRMDGAMLATFAAGAVVGLAFALPDLGAKFLPRVIPGLPEIQWVVAFVRGLVSGLTRIAGLTIAASAYALTLLRENRV
jgi:hypothetical protein